LYIGEVYAVLGCRVASSHLMSGDIGSRTAVRAVCE
jgi:hypothetical protein